MLDIQTTELFDGWLDAIDKTARRRDIAQAMALALALALAQQL